MMKQKSAISKMYVAIIAGIILVAAIIAVYYATLTPAAKELEINIYTINWRIDEYNVAISEWLEENMPNVKAKFIGLADYDAEITTLLSFSPESVDICLSRGPMWRLWVASGWLMPLDDFEGADELKAMMYTRALQSGSVEGEWYATVWYRHLLVMFYNERILEEAGFDAPPVTWEEMVDMSLTIKEKGLCEYPLAPYSMLPRTLRLNRLWRYMSTTMTEDLEPVHWDEDLNPLFLDEDSASYKAVQFLHDIIYKHKITPEALFSIEWSQLVSMLGEGEFVFGAEALFNARTLNTMETSKEAGNIKLMLWPGSHYVMEDMSGGFVIPKAAMEKGEDYKQAIWEIYRYVCGPEWKKKLDALPWLLGSPYPSVDNDAEVRASIEQYINIDAWDAQNEYLRSQSLDVNPLEYRTAWASEFDTKYTIPNLQDAIRGATPIEDAMNNIYQGFLALKEERGLLE